MFINNTEYLDQHFLIDKRVINKFIDECNISINDDIVEIGPGKCILSEIIARKCKCLILIEKDNRLEHYINVLMDKYKNVSVIWNSVLNVYIPSCDKIVSSLPYSITEPFIEKLLRCDFRECLLITGNRFALSIYNKEITKLSLLVNSFFNVEYIESIDKCSFNPEPRVTSAMIKLTHKNRNELLTDKKMFIFREMFFNRKRKLKNNLIESLIEYYKLNDKVLTKKESKKIVNTFNISDNILDKEMEQLSNLEYNIIYESINF